MNGKHGCQNDCQMCDRAIPGEGVRVRGVFFHRSCFRSLNGRSRIGQMAFALRRKKFDVQNRWLQKQSRWLLADLWLWLFGPEDWPAPAWWTREREAA